jgi:hypothetical protein
MSHSRQQYEAAFNKFVAANPAVWKRYETPAAKELVLAHMVKEQQPPSLITAELAIKKYLVRVDGGSLEKDTQVELRKITAAIDQPDLTQSEVEHFQSLHSRQLAELYWQDRGYNRFAIRFQKAVRERPYGLIFTIPGRPAGSVDDDFVEAVELTAAQYHSMPSARIIQRLRAEPGFKKAVDNLIKTGQI